MLKTEETAVHVTEKAAKQLQHLMQKENKADYALRVSVKGGGCSGLSYVLGFEKEPKPGEKEIVENGLRIFLDLKAAIYIAGTILDFSDGLNGKGFVFENPRAKTVCGCGNSFSV